MSGDQQEAPYLDAIVAYAERDPGRFHVPGHKGGEGADPELVAALSEPAFKYDIPAGIEGVDIGPDSPFQQAQRLAAEAWGAKRSWFLISGASQGNHAACLALRHAGRGVLAQRNVHSSTVDGIVLAGLEPAFVAPELDSELGIAHCLTPESLAGALDESPGVVAALTVSPTYFGAVADVRGLAEVAHSHGVPLVVDEAWGAHLRFSPELPESALECGADLVLSSVHKLFGSLTQSAILHLGRDEYIDPDVIDRCVTLTESTSPSALLTASLDAARRQAAVSGAELLHETIAGVKRAREEIRRIPGLEVLDERLIGRPGVHAWDPLRLAVDVRGTRSTGTRIGTLMREQDDVNLELVSENVIVAVFGIGEDVDAQRLAAGRWSSPCGRDPRQRGGAAFRAPHSPAALGCARDAPEAGVPRGAGGRPLRRRRRADRSRVARRLSPRHPERPAGRAAYPGDGGLHQRGRRARGLGARRGRPLAEDDAGGGGVNAVPEQVGSRFPRKCPGWRREMLVSVVIQ